MSCSRQSAATSMSLEPATLVKDICATRVGSKNVIKVRKTTKPHHHEKSFYLFVHTIDGAHTAHILSRKSISLAPVLPHPNL